MSTREERTRDTILRAALVRMSQSDGEPFTRAAIFATTEPELMVSGPTRDWQYRALGNLVTLQAIERSIVKRGYQLTGEAGRNILLELIRRPKLHALWTRDKAKEAQQTPDHDDTSAPAEERPLEESAPEGAAPTYSLEQKMDMLLLMLPRVAERLGDVAEALRTHGVTAPLRDAILDSHRILRTLES